MHTAPNHHVGCRLTVQPPIVDIRRQDPEPFLRYENRSVPGEGRAVDRVEHKDAAGLEHPVDLSEGSVYVVEMLEDVGGDYSID